MPEPASPSVPRGRHAPPLEVRLERQRERLFGAAAGVFARAGYAEASAEAIAREAGMSKATFYEHFANKEECIIALFDAAADRMDEVITAAAEAEGDDLPRRLRSGVRAFLGAMEAYPDQARTLLVEIIGAGPRAVERRDAILERFAQRIAEAGHLPTVDDAYAVVGATAELASRQLRHDRPADVADLEPVIERLLLR